ncbi:MAG: Uma2 family endonuclease, partial [Aquificaceae bacterium]
MRTLKETKKESKKKIKKQIPEALIYEKVKGKPIYYRNYEKVLKGELPLEAVMGSSDIQAYLVALIVALLYSKLDPKEYLVLTNEVGFYTSKNSYRLLDIAVFERKNFKFEGRYTKIPPKVAIEIDTKADLSGYQSVED